MTDADTTAARALLDRLLPGRGDRFVFEYVPPEKERDCFELESDGRRATLRGPNGVAQASALNWFLKYHCDCHVSWEARQFAVPSTLPRVPRTRVSSPYRHRYYFNYCTFSYSSPFWHWERWEREIDWMALNGINMPLAVTGQEKVWQVVLRDLGLSDAEIGEFFVGPAFLPFGWMGVIDGWGGPLPRSWIDGHAELQTRILARQRELGMTPVLQGFTGHVPEALGRRFPGSKLHRIDWPSSGNPKFFSYFLDPFDPLFREIGHRFVREQTRQFGTDHLYAADTFIEMTPPSDDPGFLAATARAVYEGMRGVDPEAVWVLQGWIFFYVRDFWRPPQIKALLEAVPDDHLVVLDLWTEQHPVWQEAEAFHGKPWLWCMLHNFGGRPGLYGRMQVVGSEPARVLALPERGALSGVGLTMEAIEQNSVVYELMCEMGWRSEPVEPAGWTRAYARRRYGRALPAAEEAWDILRRTVFSCERDDLVGPPTSTICRRPCLDPDEFTAGRSPKLFYDPDELARAWRLLLDCAADLGDPDAYRHDLVAVGAQVLANRATALHIEMAAAHERRDRAAFRRAGDELLDLLRDVDALLSCRPELRLERWLDDARRWATTPEEWAHYEWNARVVLTLWGPADQTRLNDYAGRHWSGLVRDFYRPRWELFVRRVDEALARGTAFDADSFRAEVVAFEEAWTRSTDGLSPAPEAELLSLAGGLWRKHGTRSAAIAADPTGPRPAVLAPKPAD